MVFQSSAATRLPLFGSQRDARETDETTARRCGVQITSPAFGLSARTQAALVARGIEKLFPIQASVLKPAMEGRDVIGRARTGTGKTLAFSLPVIEKMLVRVLRPLNTIPLQARPCRLLHPTHSATLSVNLVTKGGQRCHFSRLKGVATRASAALGCRILGCSGAAPSGRSRGGEG